MYWIWSILSNCHTLVPSLPSTHHSAGLEAYLNPPGEPVALLSPVTNTPPGEWLNRFPAAVRPTKCIFLPSRITDRNTNWRDVQKKMLHTMNQVQGHHEKMARTKTKTQNNTKTRRTLRRNRHVENNNNYFFEFFWFFFFFLSFFYKKVLSWFLQEMLSYRLGTVIDFHWVFKPVLSDSKPHTFSTCFGNFISYFARINDTNAKLRIRTSEILYSKMPRRTASLSAIMLNMVVEQLISIMCAQRVPKCITQQFKLRNISFWCPVQRTS